MLNEIRTCVYARRRFGQVQPVFTLDKVLRWIKDPGTPAGAALAKYVSDYRALEQAGKSDAAAETKKHLPCIFPNVYKEVVPVKTDGDTHMCNCLRNNFLRNDGLTILDLDKLQQEEMVELAMQLQTLDYVGFYFTSPTGNGLKVGVIHQEIEDAWDLKNLHQKLYEEILPKWLKDKCDPAIKNNSWAKCFLSSDKHAYINDSADIIPLVIDLPDNYKNRVTLNYEPELYDLDAPLTNLILECIVKHDIIRINHYNDFFNLVLVMSYHKRRDLFIRVIESLDVSQMDTKNPEKYQLPKALEKYDTQVEEEKMKKAAGMETGFLTFKSWKFRRLLYPSHDIGSSFALVRSQLRIPDENWR